MIWMHCASLGEFEQGRPLLEKLKNQYPSSGILITFFSSSGYESAKSYKGADYIFYLPHDGSHNAKRFLDVVKPSLVLWVKYEYWYYYLNEIKKRNIPLLLVSGLFTKKMGFFKWYGGLYISMLKCFTHIFVQNADSKKLLEDIGFQKNVTVSGDTRFDRVIEIAENFQSINIIDHFCKQDKVIVAGSTWEEDEEELHHFANMHTEIKIIIAPHEIHVAHLGDLKKMFKNCLLLSEYQKIYEAAGKQRSSNENAAHILIIDNIGMLSRLYHYATVTYVGGGFGESGVHNVLEAAVYGKPVLFGPVYEQYIEADELVETGGGISVNNALDLESELNRLLLDEEEYTKSCNASRNYVYSNKGATEKIIKFIQGLDWQKAKFKST
jgi:3-deoxy-D-manno-octulosonic-acid transferase